MWGLVLLPLLKVDLDGGEKGGRWLKVGERD